MGHSAKNGNMRSKEMREKDKKNDSFFLRLIT
jgi:hypothetical protein